MPRELRVGEWLVQPQRNLITKADQQVKIEPRAMEVLVYLADHADEVVSKEQLVESVWRGAFVSDEALTYAIHELRKALGDDAKDPHFIQTFPKKGYHLIGPVTRDEVASHKPGRAALWGLLGLVTLAVGMGVVSFWPTSKDPPRPLKLFVIPLPSLSAVRETAVGLVALSPDGSHLAYVATDDAGNQRLYLRPLDQTEASPIPGTEDAYNPFFSPDGQWIGFSAGGQLKKVSIQGGAPFVICDTPGEIGASWGLDDTIVFRPNIGGLMQVSAAGGIPQEVIALPAPIGVRSWGYWPEILPNGKAALFDLEKRKVGIISLETGEWRTLLEGGQGARYAPSGHLVFAQDGSLLAVPFDLNRLEVKGSAVPVLDGVRMNVVSRAVQFSISSDGSLVYLPGSANITADRTLVWVDRNGNAEPLTETRRPYFFPRLSPDGRRLAVQVNKGHSSSDIWIHELSSDTQKRLTFGGNSAHPIWTPDSKRVTFRSDRTGSMQLFWKLADGSGEAEQLLGGEYPESWSPDGGVLVFGQPSPDTEWDLMALWREEDRKSQPLLNAPYYEAEASFSPDGRWFAYTSDETGKGEIYIQAFPELGGKRQISNEGGYSPVWVASGREVIYQNGNKLMGVAVRTDPEFTAYKPRLLFEGPYELDLFGNRNWDVTADGLRFVMTQSEEEVAPTQINVILNWLDELERRVPTD